MGREQLNAVRKGNNRRTFQCFIKRYFTHDTIHPLSFSLFPELYRHYYYNLILHFVTIHKETPYPLPVTLKEFFFFFFNGQVIYDVSLLIGKLQREACVIGKRICNRPLSYMRKMKKKTKKQNPEHRQISPGKSHGRRSLVGCSPCGHQIRTRLSNFTFTFHFHALEKELATHSSVLAWRIPGTGEPGGLPSMGSHRVGHD